MLSPRPPPSSVLASGEVARGTFPSLRVRRTDVLTPPARITGPAGTGRKELLERTGHVRARGKSVSLYPAGSGDPICDAFEVGSDGETTVACLADGCGWGDKKREAARRAASGFVASLLESTAAARDVREVAAMLQKAVAAAHSEVLRGHADVWDAGTATLCGVALLPSGEEHFSACVVTVGNVHAFLCSPRHAPLEITAGSLSAARTPQDPCGRVGPYVDAGDPDMRNMQRYCVDCHEGDWIWLLTDSVVRNCPVEGTAVDLLGCSLLREAEEMTKPLREFLAANPTAASPAHLKGTLDHASVLGILAGRPPVLSSQFEWCGEASLGADPLPLQLTDTADWSRVFVCLPPYAPGSVRLECRSQLMTSSMLDHVGSPMVPGIARTRHFGWLALTDQVTRKQLGRWLQRSLASSSAVASERNLAAADVLQRDVVPERDTLQVIGRGRSAVMGGVQVSEVVVEVYGRENALIATRRLVLCACTDAQQLLDFLKTHILTAGVTTLPSLHDWAVSLLVPANEKY